MLDLIGKFIGGLYESKNSIKKFLGTFLMILFGIPLVFLFRLRAHFSGSDKKSTVETTDKMVSNLPVHEEPVKDPETLLEKAVKAEYFKYTKPEDYDALVKSMDSFFKTKSVLNSFEIRELIDGVETTREVTEGRTFAADAEILCEGGVGRLLEKMKPMFTANGISLEVKEDFSNDDYVVTVNGIDYIIRSSTDKPGPRINKWAIGTLNCMEMINDIFTRGKSLERVYAIDFAQNDCVFYIATHSLIFFFGELLEKEMPQNSYRCLLSLKPTNKVVDEELKNALEQVEDIGYGYFYDSYDGGSSKKNVYEWMRNDVLSTRVKTGLNVWVEKKEALEKVLEKCSDIEIRALVASSYGIDTDTRELLKTVLQTITISLDEVEEIILFIDSVAAKFGNSETNKKDKALRLLKVWGSFIKENRSTEYPDELLGKLFISSYYSLFEKSNTRQEDISFVGEIIVSIDTVLMTASEEEKNALFTELGYKEEDFNKAKALLESVRREFVLWLPKMLKLLGEKVTV